MAFDYKKEYKEVYLPKKKPEILEIPSMNFIAVRGHGDPNEEDGEYKHAMSGETTPDCRENCHGCFGARHETDCKQ